MESVTAKKKDAVFPFFQSLDDRVITFLKILSASCFIGLLAQIKIPLYFTPVPLTLQTLAIMLVGALLGPRHGVLATLFYLMQGCLGLPVWAGGAFGLLHFMGPTGGYRMAYILQAFLVGFFLEKQKDLKLTKITAVLLFSISLQLGLGSLWLGLFVGFDTCFSLGFTPFIPGEIAKALLIALFLKRRVQRERLYSFAS